MNVKSTLKPTAKNFFPLSLHVNHIERVTQSSAQLDRVGFPNSAGKKYIVLFLL